VVSIYRKQLPSMVSLVLIRAQADSSKIRNRKIPEVFQLLQEFSATKLATTAFEYFNHYLPVSDW